MKKIVYTLAALFVCTLSANAQKVFEDDDFETVPSFLTYDHTPYLMQFENDDDYTGSLYDVKLNKVVSFTLGSGVRSLDLEMYVDKNGMAYDINSDDFYLTQTFFNDDAEWEYIVGVEGEITNEWGTYTDIVSYQIKKLNGSVIATIPADKWYRDVYVINDVVYTTMMERQGSDDDYTYSFYTLPEFRKFLTPDPSGVKPVPAMTKTISKEAYDLMGRKASEQHKGILIKGGKKVLK